MLNNSVDFIVSYLLNKKYNNNDNKRTLLLKRKTIYTGEVMVINGNSYPSYATEKKTCAYCYRVSVLSTLYYMF